MERTPPAGLTVDELLAHAGWLRGLARTLVRDANAADDLVQETWLRAVAAPPRERAAAAGWLAAVIRNVARDAHREEGRRSARESLVARPEETPPADLLVERAEAQRRLLGAVVALDEPFRTVVLLRFFEGLAPRDIARRMGIPSATVRTRLHRALAELRRRLGEGGSASGVILLAGGLPPSVAPGSGMASIGGAVVTSKQKLGIAALVLVCIGGGAWVALGMPDDGAVAGALPDETPSAPASGSPRPRTRAGTSDPDPAGKPPGEALAPAADVASPPVARAERPHADRLAVTVLRSLAPRSAPDGVREIVDGEKRVVAEDAGEAVAVGGGHAGMVMEGWSRWHPVPPRGGVTWRGRVLDEDGKPVAGADVYRVDLDEHGDRASPTSFEWVTPVAKSGADGAFEAQAQPDGAFLVAANWNARMLRPAGLDLTGALPVRGSAKDVVAGLDLRLPFAVARFGGLRVTVRDEDGTPVGSAGVGCAIPGGGTWTDDQGRAELGGLDPGDRVVSVEATGFANATRTVEVRAGEVCDAEVKLVFAMRGTLEIAGRVVDEEGRGVQGLPMFLSDGSVEGARWTRTGADGRFRFANLTDAWKARAVDVMACPMPDRDPYVGLGPVAIKVPETSAEFTVRKLTPVRVRVCDAADRKPIALFNLDARSERPGEPPLQLHTMSAYEETGETTIHVPKGRLVIEVEGKGHRSMEIAAEVADVDSPKEIVVEMTAD